MATVSVVDHISPKCDLRTGRKHYAQGRSAPYQGPTVEPTHRLDRVPKKPHKKECTASAPAQKRIAEGGRGFNPREITHKDFEESPTQRSRI